MASAQYNGNSLTNGCDYVKQGTTITLTATDPDPQGTGEHAGNVIIYYKVWISTDGSSWTLHDSGQGNVDQPVTITLDEDSYHLIEYWAVDGCGWEETPHHYELDIVDTQAPQIVKTVGDPKVACAPGDPNNCDYYITQSTQISLTCTDQQPHPVNDVVIKYRYKVDDGLFTDWISYSSPFTFPQDSRHELQYYCVDALGNGANDIKTEVDIVDTQAPVTTKVIGDPKYIGPKDCVAGQCKVYIDGVTRISLNCVDPEPHPVNDVKVYYRYRLNVEEFTDNWIIYTEPFGFPVEGRYELEYYCVDALNNTEIPHLYETDYVDKTPPVTTKTYGIPFYTDGTSDWITNQTPITLTADDGNLETSSGVDYTKYRITLLGDDSACLSNEICQQQSGTVDFLTYTTPFTIPEQSCHLIEYYSVDNVDKTEVVKKQCVFVDNSAPNLTKSVGEPKYAPCKDAGCDYYIRQDTPITLTCEDVLPHPVNDVTIYATTYRWNGEIWELMQELNDKSGILTFTNTEDSLHKFKYWCEDALGNKVEAEEIDNVDTQAPWIIIHNPTECEANNIKRCDQSIVVEVGDEKSGVNGSTIYAELWDATDKVRGPVYLKKAVYKGLQGGDIYEGLMDKQLPPGEYTLKVYASDNLGNKGEQPITEKLKAGIYVEYMDPATCVVDILTGGNCSFTYHVCIRGNNNVSMWMDKLGEHPGLITPDMMNANIWKNVSSAYVGLIHVSDAGQLQLSPSKINGKATFDLHLKITPNITSLIGTGIQDLDYRIKAFDP